MGPDYLNRSIGTRLFADLEALARARGPVRCLIADTRENQTEANDFLRERGFEVIIRVPVSELDLFAFNKTPFVHKLEQAKTRGIRLVPLADLAGEQADWMERYWQFDTAMVQELASPDPASPRSFETFIRQKTEKSGFSPDVTHVVVYQEEWVGLSKLKPAIRRSVSPG